MNPEKQLHALRRYLNRRHDRKHPRRAFTALRHRIARRESTPRWFD